jgi:transposase InsO family protein
MPAKSPPRPAPLPRGWPKHVESALLHAIAIARTAVVSARARAACSRRRQLRLEAELERVHNEIALLREESNIKDARWSRVPYRCRPRYDPIQRMRILAVKAARGWSCAETARAFLLSEETVVSWMRRIDEEGEHALIQIPDPVNRFPDFVRELVRQLRALCPSMGKVRIAQVLARAGLHLGVTTVGRIFKERSATPDTEAIDPQEERTGTDPPRVVTAKYPGHVLHLDLTVIPTGSGFWVPWFPFTWAQSWPFCWWLAVALDHYSRCVVGFSIYSKKPTSIEVRRFLGRAIAKTGWSPRHLICDQDKIFIAEDFKAWCRGRRIRPRYGAVGKHGSIAVIERFIRSLKTECTRNLVVPYRREAIRREVGLYAVWYNEYRPSQALGGKTPNELRDGVEPANAALRYEPRKRWPLRSPCALPETKINGKRGSKVQLVVGFLEGRKHLPIVGVKPAA